MDLLTTGLLHNRRQYNMSKSYLYNGNIEVWSNDKTITSQLHLILKAPKFINYMERLENEDVLDVSSVRIDAVKWFCNPAKPDPTKLGFLYMELVAVDKRNNIAVPGVVFLRGDAVAVYIRVEVDGVEYVILTKQVRAPLGEDILEIPAGMMDASSNFAGVAMKELSEETGLTPPNIDDLIPLGVPIIPSGGGCDERIQLYYWKTTMTGETKERMKSRIFGAADENESIQLVFVEADEYEDQLLEMGDVKAICAHQFAKLMGLIRYTDFESESSMDYVPSDHFEDAMDELPVSLPDMFPQTFQDWFLVVGLYLIAPVLILKLVSFIQPV